jgi:hypothetical protein
MKIFHKIMENMYVYHRTSDGGKTEINDQFKKALDSIGFVYEFEEDITGKWVKFEISQTDARWPAISEVMQRHNIKPQNARILFSDSEMLAVDYLYFSADPYGYPQPEEGYGKITYDNSNGCDQCRMDLVQQLPFRMKSEPKWGRRGVIGLNWVFDEYFARPEIWREVFEPFGVKSRPVLKHRQGTELETVVQLDITERATAPVRTAGLASNPCPVCGRMRYSYPRYFPYPAFEAPQSLHIFKSQEYFGDGGASHRWTIVSQEMYRWILKKKVRGVGFIPMVDDPQEYIRTHLE